MSIATMNWALRQRLESHQQQILLYVIADSADPSGVTRHCDPEYMAEHARMTRATTFRRLSELEGLGLLKRLKFYSERGAPIYEIRLDLSILIKVPIKRRKGAEDDESGEDQEADHAHGTERPESQAETLGESHAATMEKTIVPCSASPQSQSCDYISPSLPKKESPPYPPPGGAVSREEGEASEKREALWQRFVQGYPGIATMDQREARAELDALTLEDAEWAVSVLPALKEELRKAHDRPPKNAHIWLRKGMFRNFDKCRIDAPAPEGVWIVEDSEEDRALRFVRRIGGRITPMVRLGKDGTRGYFHPTTVGRDLLAMLAFAGDNDLRWPVLGNGMAQCEAWQRRFVGWLGSRIPAKPGEDGIRVPCPWPPSKNGKLYLAEHLDDPEENEETPA